MLNFNIFLNNRLAKFYSKLTKIKPILINMNTTLTKIEHLKLLKSEHFSSNTIKFVMVIFKMKNRNFASQIFN